MTEHTSQNSGGRLALFRKARGLTQAQLGEATGLSKRMVAYYENTPGAQPPAATVTALATAIHSSADELLGIQPLAEKLTHSVVRLRRRLRKAESLPPEDRRALLTLATRSSSAAASPDATKPDPRSQGRAPFASSILERPSANGRPHLSRLSR